MPYLTQIDKIRFGLTAAAIAAAAYTAAAFNGTSDPFIAFFMPLLIVTGGALLWPGMRNGWHVPVSGFAASLVALCAYLGCSTLWSPVPYISHLFAVLLGCAPLLFFTLTMARRPRTAIAAALCGMAMTWIGLALYAMAQFFILPLTAGHRIAAPMLDPNNLAAFFNMGAIMAAGAFLAARGSAWRIMATLLLFALLLAATLATMSRAGLVILILGLSALAALNRPNLAQARWKLPVCAALPVALFALINMASHGWFTTSFSDLSHPAKSPSVNDRHALLVGSWHMLTAHPWGNVGLGNFYYFYPAFRLATDMSDGFFAHSDPLQLALETGLPVLVFFYVMLGAAAIRSAQAWRTLPRGSGGRDVLAASGIAVGSIALHAHINYNLYMPGLLIPAGILLAVWYAATEAALPSQRAVWRLRTKWQMPARVGLILLTGLAACLTARVGITSWQLDRVSALDAAGRRPDAEHLADQLLRYGDRANFSVSEMRARMALEDFSAAADAQDRAAMLQRGLAAIQTARAQNPAFTTFMSLEAQFYFLGRDTLFPGGLEKAQLLLERAVPLNPLDVDSREGLAVVYQAQGRMADAVQVMADGTRWPRPKGAPDVTFYISLARAYRLAGDAANADGAMKFAADRAQAYGMTTP